MIQVLLVDDHPVVRAGYRRILDDDPGIRVVGEAQSAEQGYAEFCRLLPNVGVIDLSMAGMGGIGLMQRILAREPAARLLAFSMHEDALYAGRALQAGARGYLTKAAPPHSLIEAVQAVHAGGTFLDPRIGQRRAVERLVAADPLRALSPKELEVMRLLAQGRAVAEIAAALRLSPKTIANYQTQIRDKLELRSAAELVHLAARCGLVSMAPPL
jgi:two-component system invasion response regulator UvrY